MESVNVIKNSRHGNIKHQDNYVFFLVITVDKTRVLINIIIKATIIKYSKKRCLTPARESAWMIMKQYFKISWFCCANMLHLPYLMLACSQNTFDMSVATDTLSC